MGIFSTNRYGSVGTDVVIEAAEGYHGEIGAAIAMIEGYQNDMALFNGIIMTDFQESALIHEGASAEEVYVLQEGALSGAWEKIKQFFKKLGEKIKGIFHAFIAKMDSVFMKDANEFYKKYVKDINNKKSWEGFKCKVKPIKGDTAIISFKEEASGYLALNASADAQKKIDDWDSEKEFETAASVYTGLTAKVSDSTEFKKEYFDQIFDTEETKDDWNASAITDGYIGKYLKDKESLKNLNKTNDKIEKNIKGIISAIEKEQRSLDKIDRDNYKGDYQQSTGYDGSTKDRNATKTDSGKINTKEELTSYSAMVNLTHKKALVIQDVFNAYASASVEAYKEACAQARRVFAAAVAFGPKKEDADLAMAEGDVAFYEACDLMDTMYAIEA